MKTHVVIKPATEIDSKPRGTLHSIHWQIPTVFEKLEDMEHNEEYEDAFKIETWEQFRDTGVMKIEEVNNYMLGVLSFKEPVNSEKFPFCYFIAKDAKIYEFPENVRDQKQLDEINAWIKSVIEMWAERRGTGLTTLWKHKVDANGNPAAYDTLDIYIPF